MMMVWNAQAVGMRVIWGALCFALVMPLQAQHPSSSDPERELRIGAALTHEGKFEEAIPHLIAARSRVAEEYAASFNLALCYLGTRRFQQAIDVLEELHTKGHNTAALNNLLAQAYVGAAKPEKAFAALRQAALLTPNDEKLYVFVADACTDNRQYELGLRVVELGLQYLPSSARLHYEYAMFLARLDRYEEAKPEFERAAMLAQGGDITYLARAQEFLFEDDLPGAIRTAREGISNGHHSYVLQDLLAEVLIHSGVTPGQAECAEARSLLENAVAQKPDYSTAQIALGKLYLMEGRLDDAVVHLETGRRLEPENPAIYSSLANAYRRLGEEQKARQMLDELGKLLQNAHVAEATSQK
ncbi:MAG TPA: tetratricopeptide repeat protein [Pseudacidobacterium sp.]|jgi:predicted Zn-dependent protease|nr:tetratricopeptide repeat protein [Pseudacidobacterium sp.]